MNLLNPKIDPVDRLESFEENRRYVNNALEMALTLCDFQGDIFAGRKASNILEKADDRIQRLIPFPERAFYLVDPSDSGFELVRCEPADTEADMREEVDFLIEQDFFAWALRENRGIFVASHDRQRLVFLHVIATHNRIRGMFIGMLDDLKPHIPDSSRALISMILLNSANALESVEFYDLLHRKNGILQKEVEDKTTELLRAERHLQKARKLEAIGTLAGGVAHDLNNVLGGIVSYPEFIIMQLPEDSPLRPQLKLINESGRKAAAIVQDLLTLARRNVTVKDVVNLVELISSYLESPEHHRLTAQAPDVIVRSRHASDVITIEGSAIHLLKMLMNLVSNAVEAMPDGGTIDIRVENRHLANAVTEAPFVPEGEYVVLCVADNGPGIAEADMERIFEPFYSNKVLGQSGTGLGMAVVKGTVDDHNGYIKVHSAEDEGTTFEIYFPASGDPASYTSAPPSPVTQDIPQGHGERILIVDDVAAQRVTATEILEFLGYVTESVASGEAAIEFLSRERVDLVLLDLIMDPGISGLETLRRAKKIHPDLKFVIASGYADLEGIKESRALGAQTYVKKPYTVRRIANAVQEGLSA